MTPGKREQHQAFERGARALPYAHVRVWADQIEACTNVQAMGRLVRDVDIRLRTQLPPALRPFKLRPVVRRLGLRGRGPR